MTQGTHELMLPQQSKRETEPAALEVGDIAFVQRSLLKKVQVEPENKSLGYKDQWTVQSFIGRLTRTPESHADVTVSTTKAGLPPALRMYPLYVLTEVTLLESDNTERFEAYNDICFDPDDNRYYIDHYDAVADLRDHGAEDVVDLR